MSAKWKALGAGIAIIGVSVMFFSIMNSANEAREDMPLPTPELFLEKMGEITGGAIILFIGFAIIAIGRWLCRRSSN